MNFSKKEKNLLTILGVVAIIAVYFNFFLYPQNKKINTLRAEIKKFNETVRVNEAYKKEVEGMDRELKIISQRFRDLREKYPPFMNYDEVLITIKKIAEDSKINIDTIGFTEPLEVQKGEPLAVPEQKNTVQNKQDSNNKQPIGNVAISDVKLKDFVSNLGIDDVLKAADSNGKSKEARIVVPNGKLYSISVKISGKAANSQLKCFIAMIEGLKNKALIKDMQITAESKDSLMFNIAIDLYGIMDRNAGEYKLLSDGTWKPMNPSNKENIFEPYEGYPGPLSLNSATVSTDKGNYLKADNSKQAEEKKYDFDMSIRPYGNNMAPPTISISARSFAQGTNAGRAPVVYGDNKGDEKVELYIEEINGKYMFKFRTESEAFPANDYSAMCELNAGTEDLKMLIVSSSRKLPEDKSGANLNIHNKTSKKFVIEVKDEDKQKPRLRVNKLAGNIEVVYDN